MRLISLALLLVLALAACASDDAAGTAGSANDDVAAADHAGHGGTSTSSVDRMAGGRLDSTLIPDPEATGFQGALLDIPVPKPDFVLDDTSGEAFDFRAETADAAVTMLYFGYTTCPDICPGHMAAIASALRSVDPEIADQVDVVFISVDTVNDTPELLREYLDSFDESFVGLTGSVEEVNGVMADMGLTPTAIDDMADFPPSHPINIVTFTGDAASIAYPFGVHGGAIAEDLPTLVNRGVSL